jgi:hypothetical protein
MGTRKPTSASIIRNLRRLLDEARCELAEVHRAYRSLMRAWQASIAACPDSYQKVVAGHLAAWEERNRKRCRTPDEDHILKVMCYRKTHTAEETAAKFHKTKRGIDKLMQRVRNNDKIMQRAREKGYA